MESPTCWIDDFGPLPVAVPQTVAELGDIVRSGANSGQAIYPLGGRTMLGLGLTPSRPGLAIDLTRLNRIIDYPARDMTMTVQAGITIDQLQDRLAAENQRLPIDVPLPDQATLGGSLATNISGPRRFGFGTLRDYVLGISVVNDEGQEVKAGGRVVKNVAGYDLCKLFIGSLGTLGIITQVTLKLRPRPEEQALVALGCTSEAAGPLLDQLHGSRTRPVCLCLLNEGAARYISQQAGVAFFDGYWVVLVGFEDNREAVGWQIQQIIRELSAGLILGLDTKVGSAARPWFRSLVEFQAQTPNSLTFKANMLPSHTASFCLQAQTSFPQMLLAANAGNGIVYGRAEGDLTLEQASTLLQALQDWAAGAKGNVVVTSCPPAWKRSLPIWGRGQDLFLMRRVKEKMDPGGLFNPGRFVDGI